MRTTIDYYFTPDLAMDVPRARRASSAIARRHARHVDVKPVDFGKVFPVSGGLPLRSAPPQRQAYRLVELARWSKHLGVPLNLQPKFFPGHRRAGREVDPRRWRQRRGEALALTGALVRALWAEERDIADAATLDAIAAQSHRDSDAKPLPSAPRAADIAAALRRAARQEAIDRGVFGAPSYVIDGEIVLGTGPARLRRSKTGKIACFPRGRRQSRRPGGKGDCASSPSNRGSRRITRRGDRERATGAQP